MQEKMLHNMKKGAKINILRRKKEIPVSEISLKWGPRKF